MLILVLAFLYLGYIVLVVEINWTNAIVASVSVLASCMSVTTIRIRDMIWLEVELGSGIFRNDWQCSWRRALSAQLGIMLPCTRIAGGQVPCSPERHFADG